MKRLLSWGLLAAFFGVVTIFSSPALALPPTNDNLRDAVRTTLPFLHQTNMGESTKEIDESSPTCGLISGSAWYRYDSVSAQTIRATTYGSSSDFILAAYKVNTLSTGFSFADLEAVACNDNSAHSASQASLSFTTEAGKIYYFQAATNALSFKGALRFSLGVVPTNDTRANAINLNTMSFPVATSNIGSDSDDYSFACAPGGSSIWYCYTPTATTHVKVSTNDANFDVVVQVSIPIGASRATWACNRLQVSGVPTVFQADPTVTTLSPGSTYLIQIGGYDGQQGNFSLDFDTGQGAGVVAGDDFSSSTNVGSLAFQDRVVGKYATAEFYEPQPCFMGTHTAWYSYTPTVNERVNINTVGSDFDTVIAMYTGSSVSALTQVTCSDDISSTIKQSSITWDLLAGVTYRFQVGEHQYMKDQLGSLVFEMRYPTSNDDFAQATSINPLSLIDFRQSLSSAETVLGTLQSGEPLGCAIDKTFWWKFTPAADLRLTIDTRDSSYPTRVAVYTGTALSSLSSVSCNTSASTTTMSMDADAGVTYYLQVGASSSASTYGTLSLKVSGFLIPVGDRFHQAVELGSMPASFTGTTLGTNFEPSEPNGCMGFETVWAKATLSPGTYTADTLLSTNDTRLGVFKQTGSSLSTLTQVGCSNDHNGTYQSQVSFTVPTSATYYFQISGPGVFTLGLRAEQVPSNDLSSAAIDVGSDQGERSYQARTFVATTSGALGCGGLGKDVWYKFTLSTRTLVRADTLGSDFDTAIELWSYSGGSFTFVSCSDNPWPSVNDKMEQTLDPGTYYLRIGGANQASGVMKLKVGTFAIPAHDLFSGAKQIPSLPYADPVDVSTYVVGTESGEPDPYSTKNYCGHNWNTVWYKYTPSASTLLTADIYGTQGVLFNTVISVYKQTGSSISTLQLVDCNSDNHNFGNGLQSSVAVNAQAGQTYYFQVGGYWGDTGSLRFRLQTGTRPGNDDAGAATVVTPQDPVISSETLDTSLHATIATLESGELQPCGGIAATVWFQYDNASSGALEIALAGNFRSVIAVYERSPLTSELLLRACQVGSAISNNKSSNTLKFTATPGLRYLYQVGGYKGDSGEMDITFSQVPD